MRTLFALFALNTVLIGGWAIYRLICGASAFSVAEITPLLVAAGVLIALLTLLLNRRRSQSEDYLEHAQDLLEKAYTRLAMLDDKGRPQNKRLNWLTAARLIKTALAVAAKIKERSHQDIWREELNYWRGRFYDMIFPNIEGFPPEYYAEKPEHMYVHGSDDRELLSLTSLAVLYRFIKWPEGQGDPIHVEPAFTKEEREAMLHFGPRGLGKLLEKVENCRNSKKSGA